MSILMMSHFFIRNLIIYTIVFEDLTCYVCSRAGMLCMGVALRNVPVINVAKDIEPHWSSALRSVFKSDWFKF